MNMRKMIGIFGLGVLLLVGPAVGAMEEAGVSFGKHELSVGWGFGTVQEMLWLLEDIIVISGGQTLEDAEGSGAVSVSYRYHPNRTWAFGLTAVFEKIEATYANPDETRASNTIAVLGTARLKYLDRGALGLYSGIGLGWCRIFDQGKFMGFQATLLGANLRLGGSLGLFAELGAGFQGILHLGATARF